MPIWEANWLSRKEKNPLAHTKTAAPWGDTSKNWVISSVHSLILNHKLRSCLCVFEINSFLWLSDCFVLLSKQRYEEIGHFLNITPTVSACNTSHLLFSVEPHPILVMLPIPAFVPICIAHALRLGKTLLLCGPVLYCQWWNAQQLEDINLHAAGDCAWSKNMRRHSVQHQYD